VWICAGIYSMDLVHNDATTRNIWRTNVLLVHMEKLFPSTIFRLKQDSGWNTYSMQASPEKVPVYYAICLFCCLVILPVP